MTDHSTQQEVILRSQSSRRLFAHQGVRGNGNSWVYREAHLRRDHPIDSLKRSAQREAILWSESRYAGPYSNPRPRSNGSIHSSRESPVHVLVR